MINFLLSALIVFSAWLLVHRRGLIFLQIAQQDEYAPKSLWYWYKQNLAFDKIVTLASILIITLAYLSKLYFLTAVLALIALGLIIFITIDPRKQAKLALIVTDRAKRTLIVFHILVFILIIIGLQIHFNCHAVFLLAPIIVLTQLIPFILIASLFLLQPYEQRVQNNYLKDAQEIFLNAKPFVVGVTGSYGKTSVKNALGEVLQASLSSVFWPKEGVNTLMGVVSEIRSKLSNNHEYAVVEMAAYRPGSIAKLCNLTPPKAAIITAIGKQHLERFGSLDVTYQAKTELAQAVPEDGILIVNADSDLAYKAALEFKKATTLLYGINDRPDLDLQAKNITFSSSGTSFDIIWGKNTYHLQTELLGKAAVSNLLAVFAMAITLGAKTDLVITAISNLKPVKNRLALEKAGDVTYLHDAYNSNEIGFQSALEVLEGIEGQKKILMTPGVIELGAEQFEINKELAELAGKVCDHIIIVGPPNKEAFIQGLDGSEKLIVADNREKAFCKLQELQSAGAVILIENDLTDFHETKYRF